MKKLLLAILLSNMLTCFAQSPQIKSISNEKIGSVLSCLRTKLPSYPDSPPLAKPHSYLVRYYYGVLTPGYEETNELQLIVYAPKEDSAVLYQVYLDRKGGKESIYIGQRGTLIKRDGNMETDDIPGGIATEEEWEKLLKVISRQDAIVIPERDVKPGSEACIYQQ